MLRDKLQSSCMRHPPKVVKFTSNSPSRGKICGRFVLNNSILPIKWNFQTYHYPLLNILCLADWHSTSTALFASNAFRMRYTWIVSRMSCSVLKHVTEAHCKLGPIGLRSYASSSLHLFTIVVVGFRLNVCAIKRMGGRRFRFQHLNI